MASGFRKRDAAGWAIVLAGLIGTGILAPVARGQGTQEKIYLAYPATPGKAPPPAYMIVITYPRGIRPSSTEGLPAGSRIQGNKILLPAGQALPTTFTLGLGVATEVPAFVQFPETVTPPVRTPILTPIKVPLPTTTWPQSAEPQAADPLDLGSASFKGPDGTVDDASVALAQRGTLDALNKELGVQLRAAETPHFLIFSDAEPALIGQHMKIAEHMYARMCKELDLDPTHRCWNGKCLIVVFADAAKYEDYMRRFTPAGKGYRAESLPAYCDTRETFRGIKTPRVFFSPLASEPGDIMRYEAQMLVYGYMHPAIPPPWIQEGLTCYIAFAESPGTRQRYLGEAAAAAKAGTSLAELLPKPDLFANPARGRGIAYSVNQILLEMGRPQFKAFLQAIKQKQPWDRAISGAYGVTLADVDRRWRAEMAKAAPGQVAAVPPAPQPPAVIRQIPDQRPDQPAQPGKTVSVGGYNIPVKEVDKFLFGPDTKDPLCRLSGNWRAADGTINQTAFTTAQRGTLDGLNKSLGVRLRLVETPRFIIFSDADAAMTDLLVKGCDALYANLCKQFDFGARDRVWDGKCCVLVFGSSVSYETRAKKFDDMAADFSAEATPAYASVIGGPPGVPRLAYMCFSSGRRDPDAVVHEVTHIFFKAYASPGKLPLWLQEGVAVFMEVVNDPKMRGTYLGPAVRFARSGSAMSYFYGIAAPRDFKPDHYCVAYSLVEMLVARDRTKFKAFVQGIRDGKSAEDAMKASYAFGLSDLERQWRVWIMSPGIAKFDTGGPSTPGMKFSPANTTDK